MFLKYSIVMIYQTCPNCNSVNILVGEHSKMNPAFKHVACCNCGYRDWMKIPHKHTPLSRSASMDGTVGSLMGLLQDPLIWM